MPIPFGPEGRPGGRYALSRYGLWLWVLMALIPILREGNGVHAMNVLDTLRQDGRHFLETGADVLLAPLRFESGDWQRVGLWLAGTAGLSTQDLRLKRLAQSRQSRWADLLFAIDAYHGNQYTQVYLMIAYGAGLVLDMPRLRRTALYATEALTYVGLISAAIKVVVGRQRPYGGDDPYVFRPFNGSVRYRSFTSGHTVVAFAASTVVAEQVDHPMWKGFFYGAAVLVAAARIYHNAHWLSDVVPSAALGYAVGWRVLNRSTSPKPSTLSLKITPLRVSGTGVNLVGLHVLF